ncbi:MAG TPA: cbb3-type cytochrome c oxidase N-terminal domain-containing protein [Edaphocola sp.]|nr:cbb3-type cytochrome c oxidase N-terminal domain-containing protein [Edaphocola sp.]
MYLKYKKQFLIIAGFLLAGLPNISFAQDADYTPIVDNLESARYVLVGLAVLLLGVIYVLTKVVSAGMVTRKKQILESRRKNKAKSSIILLLLSLSSLTSFAQDAAEETVAAVVKEPGFIERFFSSYPMDIWMIITLILVEIAVIFSLLILQIKLLKERKTKVIVEDEEENLPWWGKLFDKLGAKNTKEDIEKLDLHHDYDGIRELDNKIPGWWNLAFLGTIIISVIYFVRFLTGSLPDQITELEVAQKKAEVRMAEYLKTTGGDVDENTVTMLDAAGIAKGATIYEKNCVACHGAKGEGGLGPNLTDEYWIHKGGLKDIFYSIKYGWPEKGMKAWKDDFSPIQMAELTSYVKSLVGTNPPNAKAKEGELYIEDAAGSAPTEEVTIEEPTKTDN